MAIPCPCCGHQFRLQDRSLLGQKARCPECNRTFRLDERAESKIADDSRSKRETVAPGEPAESLAEPSTSSESILKEFGRYQLLRQLGQGAMGTVYLARDIYSLGVVLYELLAGEVPFEGAVGLVMALVLTQEPQNPSQMRPDLDRRLEAICLKMMAKEIEDRYQSMDDVITALTNFLSNPTPPATILSAEADLAPDESDSPTSAGSALTTTAEPPKPEQAPARPKAQSDKKREANPAKQQRRAMVLFQAAQECLEAHDYERAIKLLQQIPDAQLTEDAQNLLDEAIELQDEVTFLTIAMDDPAYRGREVDLRPLLKRLLELKPGHRRARQAYRQLAGKKKTGGRTKKLPGRQQRKTARRRWIISGVVVLVVALGLIALSVMNYLNNGVNSPPTQPEVEAAAPPLPRTISKPTLTILGHTNEVTSVAFSPDGQRIVSGSNDNTVRLWDAKSGRESHTLNGHTDPVDSVAFSPDGQRIVSGSWDNTLKVWDAANGQATLTLKGHSSWVDSVAFSPDGKRIVSGNRDGTLKVWDISKVPAESPLTPKIGIDFAQPACNCRMTCKN